jgi:hypothetical protein
MKKHQEDFEPVFEGMSFSNIDCKGFPNSVTISNGKDLYNFETRDYVPLEAVEELIEKSKPKKPDITVHNGFCPNCHQAFGLERTKEAMIRPRWFSFCPYCGQAIDWSEDECCN